MLTCTPLTQLFSITNSIHLVGFALLMLVAGCDTRRHTDSVSVSPHIDLPQRPNDARDGSQIATSISGLSLHDREKIIFDEVAAGNVPSFNRRFSRVEFDALIDGKTYSISINVLPEYLAIGSDDDPLLMPLSPVTAQRLADLTHTSLPTPKMVDEIWKASDIKLTPSPIPPGPEMTTVPVFEQHNGYVLQQRVDAAASSDHIVAGHKKDVVLTSKLDGLSGRVAIFGWHSLDGSPIQPLYTGHSELWVDYSHGIRLIDSNILVNGNAYKIDDVLKDSALSRVLSYDGRVSNPRYSTVFVDR